MERSNSDLHGVLGDERDDWESSVYSFVQGKKITQLMIS